MDKLIKRLIEDYPELEEATPSSWIMLRPSGRSPSVHSLDVCHAALRYADMKGKFNAALLAYPNQSEAALAYINYLIDHQYKNFKHLLALKTFGDEYYIHVTGLDEFPANAFMSFCIATRGPIEFYSTIEHWFNLVNLGVKPNLAIILAGLSNPFGTVKSLDEKLDCIGPPSVGHWWFDMGTDWIGLLNGEMPHASNPYMDHPMDCWEVNTLWGGQLRHITMGHFQLTIRELMERFN